MASSFSYHRARALRDWCDLGPERAQLMAALGGVTLEVVDRLYAHGVRTSTLYALEWLPAVDRWWVDGADAAARDAIRAQFLEDPRATRAGSALFDEWLRARPVPALLAAAWYAISAQLVTLDADARAATVARLVARCDAAGRTPGTAAGRDPRLRARRDSGHRQHVTSAPPVSEARAGGPPSRILFH